MYSKRVRIILIIVLLCLWLSAGGYYLVTKPADRSIAGFYQAPPAAEDIEDAYALLRARRDSQALRIFEQILSNDSGNIQARWGTAEVLRRENRFGDAERILVDNLEVDPQHPPSLLTLAYIRYKEDDLAQAQEFIAQAMCSPQLSRQDKGLGFMLKGAINSRRSQGGWLFGKLIYGPQIKGYLLKARELAPQLPEVHLGLGTFYLLAPKIAGGNLERAIEELHLALDLAPDFATASARLAQAYGEAGNTEEYDYYIERARRIDPNNEVLQELFR